MGYLAICTCNPNSVINRSEKIWQWDYGKTLRIQGLTLPPAVEIHFSLTESGGEAPKRVGTTKDGVTDVVIPESMLENGGISVDYNIFAFIYLTDEESGETTYKIIIPVRSRPKPEAFEKPEEAELFRKAIDAVNESSVAAREAEKSSEAWAHGHPDYPERDTDNAAYYAGRAKEIASGIPGQVEIGKKSIDAYVRGKEAELKGDTGNVYFAAFRVINGRLKMYSDPSVDKVRFVRVGSRLKYRLAM